MVKARIEPRIIAREYAQGLKNRFKIDKIILFGSALTSRFNKHSDIDLIVLSEDFKKIGFLRRLELLSHARSGVAREVPMDIVGYTREEFERLSKESCVLREAKQSGRLVWP